MLFETLAIFLILLSKPAHRIAKWRRRDTPLQVAFLDEGVCDESEACLSFPLRVHAFPSARQSDPIGPLFFSLVHVSILSHVLEESEYKIPSL